MDFDFLEVVDVTEFTEGDDISDTVGIIYGFGFM